MHTSSGVDAVDEYLETVTKKRRPLHLQVRRRRTPRHRQRNRRSLPRPARAWPRRSSPSTAPTTAPSSARPTVSGSPSASCRSPSRRSRNPTRAPRRPTTRPTSRPWSSRRTPPTTPSMPTTPATSPTSTATTFPAAIPLRLDQARRWQQSRHRMEGPPRSQRSAQSAQPQERLALQHQQLALVRRRSRQPQEARTTPPMSKTAANPRAASTPSASSRTKRISRSIP